MEKRRKVTHEQMINENLNVFEHERLVKTGFIQRKKEKVRIPRNVDESIGKFVQNEKDFWSILASNLNPLDYGGVYVNDEGALCIKVIQKANVTSLINSTSQFLPNEFKEVQNNVIIEEDAIYTMTQLNEAVDKLFEAKKKDEIDFIGVGTYERINGLFVEAKQWNESLKKSVSEISNLEMDHLDFRISTGDFKDQGVTRAGDLINNEDTGRVASAGCGVYYEITNTRGETFEDYGWVTAGHYVEESDEFNNINDYMGFVDFVNLGYLGDNSYIYADAAVIYRPKKKTECDFTMSSYLGKLVLNTGTAIENESILRVGGYSNSEGKVTSANYSMSWDGQGPGNYRYMVQTTCTSVGGDSGGPLFRVRSDGNYTLLGILKGIEHDTSRTIYTAWSSLESRLRCWDSDYNCTVEMWLWP